MIQRQLHRLTTPRAAAAAGVLFGVALVLIRTALPEGAEPGSQWIDGASTRLRVASILMPFAGIAFLWFIGVVRDGFGRYEDRFFSSVFLGSGILFLAMMFVASAVGAALIAGRAGPEVATFGQMFLMALSKTYAVRMAAVFMISLATIWMKTGLMPRSLALATYLVAVTLLIAGDLSMWLTLSFPVWVLTVSLLFLGRAGIIGPGRRPRNLA